MLDRRRLITSAPVVGTVPASAKSRSVRAVVPPPSGGLGAFACAAFLRAEGA